MKKHSGYFKKHLSRVIAVFCVAVVIVFLAVTFALSYSSIFYADITFDTDHGTEIKPVKIKIGTAPAIPQTAREYNTFGGWYLDKEHTVPYGGEKLYKNTTLYAKWNTVFTRSFFEGYAENLKEAYRDFLMTGGFYDLDPEAILSNPAIFAPYKGMKINLFAGSTYDGIETELAIGLLFPTWEKADAFYKEIAPRFSYQINCGNTTLIRKDVLLMLVATGNEATFLGTLSETEDYVFALNEEGTEASVVRYKKNEATVTVPETYNGLPVTAIGAFSFAGKTVSEITLGNALKTAGKYAFLQCANLEHLSLPGQISMLGNAFITRSGITSAEDLFLNGSEFYQLENGALYDNVRGRLLRYFGGGTDLAIRAGTVVVDAYAFEGAYSLENVVFPEGLKMIDREAFLGCYSLREAVFPQSLQSIGFRAFSCSLGDKPSALASVLFSPGCYMEEIMDNAFENNASLTNFSFPEGVLTWGNDILGGSTSLIRVVLPKDMKEIPKKFFKNCASLTTLEVTSKIEIVQEEAFRNCASLIDFDFSQVTYIGNYAFENCASLTAIELTDKLEYYDPNAFYGCVSVKKLALPSATKDFTYWMGIGMNNLEEISVPMLIDQNRMQFSLGSLLTPGLKKITINNAVNSIPDSFFTGLAGITEIVLPEGIEAIGESAFSMCVLLSNVVLPSSVKSIGDHAFYRCESIASVNLPQGLTEIGDRAYRECASLASIKFPSSLKRIGESAFSACPLLESAILPDFMEYVGFNVFGGCFQIRELCVPLSDDINIFPQSIWSYTQNVDNVEKVTVSPGTTVIPRWAFFEMEKLEELSFPSTVERFEDGALAYIPNIKKLDISCTGNYGRAILEGCEALEELTLNMSDDHADDKPGYFGYFFRNFGGRHSGYTNSSIKKITVVSKNKSLGADAFLGAKGLIDLVLPATLTEISESMFMNCVSLKNITLPAGVTAIGRAAFGGCLALEEITIPSKVNTIGARAFNLCSSLRRVNIAEGSELYSLGEGLFEDCVSLEDIGFRDFTVWRIPDFAFFGCTSLKGIRLPANLQKINSNAFSHSGLVSVSIPSRVDTLGWFAFADCAQLKTVEFRDRKASNLTKIESYAFINCVSLERIVFPESLLVVNPMAFNNCSALREVYVMREYDYRMSWNQAGTRLEIGDGPATFEGCHPDIVFYVPTRNGNVEYDGQYGPGSKGGVTAYKEYAIGWKVYEDKIEAMPVGFTG